jgi:hypothetical protein
VIGRSAGDGDMPVMLLVVVVVVVVMLGRLPRVVDDLRFCVSLSVEDEDGGRGMKTKTRRDEEGDWKWTPEATRETSLVPFISSRP